MPFSATKYAKSVFYILVTTSQGIKTRSCGYNPAPIPNLWPSYEYCNTLINRGGLRFLFLGFGENRGDEISIQRGNLNFIAHIAYLNLFIYSCSTRRVSLIYPYPQGPLLKLMVRNEILPPPPQNTPPPRLIRVLQYGCCGMSGPVRQRIPAESYAARR